MNISFGTSSSVNLDRSPRVSSATRRFYVCFKSDKKLITVDIPSYYYPESTISVIWRVAEVLIRDILFPSVASIRRRHTEHKPMAITKFLAGKYSFTAALNDGSPLEGNIPVPFGSVLMLSRKPLEDEDKQRWTTYYYNIYNPRTPRQECTPNDAPKFADYHWRLKEYCQQQSNMFRRQYNPPEVQRPSGIPKTQLASAHFRQPPYSAPPPH